MATKTTKAGAKLTANDSTEAVDAFMKALAHPFKAEVQALRQAILAASPSISEGIKWNSPSFRTTEYFATTHLRGKDCVGLVLHLGAKARDLPKGGLRIDDPKALLRWLAEDRAMVQFHDTREVEASRPALQAVIRDWIRYV